MFRRPLTTNRFGARATLLRGASVLALAAGGVSLTLPARADTPAYQGPTNGAWGTGLNWTTGAAPNAGSDTTVKNGRVVNTDGDDSTATLTVGPTTGSGVTISDHTKLTVGGALTNRGLITLNSSGNTTELWTAPGGTITLSDGGTLQLSNSSLNLIWDGSNSTGSLVNVDNTIQGSGNIGVTSLGLTN